MSHIEELRENLEASRLELANFGLKEDEHLLNFVSEIKERTPDTEAERILVALGDNLACRARLEERELMDKEIEEFIKIMEKCKLSKIGTVWTSFHKIFEVNEK